MVAGDDDGEVNEDDKGGGMYSLYPLHGTIFPINPAMASECWSVLSVLPYHIRYALYASWRQYGLGKAALLSHILPPKPLANIASEVTTGMTTKS